MVCLNMGLAAVAAMSLLAHTSAAAPQLVAGPDVSAANETEVFAGNATDGGNKTECTKRLGMHCPWRAEIKTIRVLPDDEWIAVERREEVLEPQPATTASTETAAAATTTATTRARARATKTAAARKGFGRGAQANPYVRKWGAMRARNTTARAATTAKTVGVVVTSTAGAAATPTAAATSVAEVE